MDATPSTAALAGACFVPLSRLDMPEVLSTARAGQLVLVKCWSGANAHCRRSGPAQISLRNRKEPCGRTPLLDHDVDRMRRYFDTQLQQEMLLCLIIEETPDELVVVTVYRTSQIAKFLKGVQP